MGSGARTAAEGVTNRDSPTPWVDLFMWNSDLVDGIESLRSERLVDLVRRGESNAFGPAICVHLIEIYIILGDSVLFQQLWDGVGRANAHDPRGNTNNRSTNELADNGETQLLGDRTPGEKDGSGAIGNLRRVSGVRETVLGKRWLQLGQRLGSDAIPDAVVLVNNNLGLVLCLGIDELDGEGNNLILELALFLSSSSLDERLGRELVLFLTTDTKVLGDVLRGDPHGEETVPGVRDGKDLLRDDVWPGRRAEETKSH
jgi:hypothetical protein